MVFWKVYAMMHGQKNIKIEWENIVLASIHICITVFVWECEFPCSWKPEQLLLAQSWAEAVSPFLDALHAISVPPLSSSATPVEIRQWFWFLMRLHYWEK